jgi:hypothetical protein
MPAAEWAAAIVARHSVRTYLEQPLAPAVLDHLEEFCRSLPGREVARVEIVRQVPAALFTGIVGGYGKVRGAPSALVVVAHQEARAHQESAGYVGEAVILQATTLGLGTCWVAGFFDRELGASLLPLAPAEQVLAVSPLGHPERRPRLSERLLKRAVGAHSRRPVEEIAPGFSETNWPAWAAQGVRLARLAPSAVNRQPWRFELEADPTAVGVGPVAAEPTGQLVISATSRGPEGNIPRRLDCGIAMLHFEVGARLLGAQGQWEILEPPRVARYRVVPG